MEWDGERRLVAINYTGTTIAASSPMMGRPSGEDCRKDGSTVTSHETICLVGKRIAQGGDANNINTRRYSGTGERRGLGQVMQILHTRETTLGAFVRWPDRAGAVPPATSMIHMANGPRRPVWGRTLEWISVHPATIHHPPSGLICKLYRDYRPTLGEGQQGPASSAELLKAPIIEYRHKDPGNRTDALGLQDQDSTGHEGYREDAIS